MVKINKIAYYIAHFNQILIQELTGLQSLLRKLTTFVI
jgi:hypothetical protein